MSYEEFLKLPSGLTDYVTAIRASDSLKESYNELGYTDDKFVKKKLNDNIRELEAFFK